MEKNSTFNRDVSTEFDDLLLSGNGTRTFDDDLARMIGISEATIVNQIHYWLKRCRDSKHYHNGKYWTYESYKSWERQLTCMSHNTIIRMLEKLVEYKIVIVDNFNDAKWDKTKWYTLDYDMIRKVKNGECNPRKERKIRKAKERAEAKSKAEETQNTPVQNEHPHSSKNEQSEHNNSEKTEKTPNNTVGPVPNVGIGSTQSEYRSIPKVGKAIPKTSTKNPPKNSSNMDYPDKRDNHTSEKNQDEDEQPSFKNKPIAKREDIEAGLSMLKSLAKPEDMFCINCIEYYFDKFEDCEGHPHFQIEFFDMDKVKRTMDPYFQYVDEDIMKSAIDVHFETEYPTKPIDYDIRHFATDGILKHRLYECGCGHIDV